MRLVHFGGGFILSALAYYMVWLVMLAVYEKSWLFISLVILSHGACPDKYPISYHLALASSMLNISI